MDRLHVSLSDWQKKVWKDDKRYIVVNCGRRSGKTTVVAWKLFYLATQKEKQILWYVAPTYKQAKQILWEMLIEMIPKEAIEKRNETELKIILKNKSRIEVKGADNVDSLRGVRIDFCVFDECAFIDRWASVWKVMRPTLVDSKAACMFISTPNGFNHFRELAYNQTPDGTRIFGEKDHSYHHYTSYDNPFLDRTELDTMRREMNEDSFEQEIMGEFRKMAGLIYKDFKREIHMVDIPFDRFDSNWTYTRALDFGFGHKTSLGYYAISPDQTEIYRYDGLYVSGFNEGQIAEVVKTKDAGRYIVYPVADSAQPMSISELQGHGANFNPVEKGRDSVKNGIVKVAELLKVRADTGRPTLMFNRHHAYVADEFERYRWIENKNDKSLIREIPYKALDDCMDEVRYFAMSWKQKTTVKRYYNRNDWGIT